MPGRSKAIELVPLIHEIRARLATGEALPISALELSRPVSRAALEAAERKLGAPLPGDYVEFVTSVGLLTPRDRPTPGAKQGRALARMLSPREIVERARYQRTFTEGLSLGYDDEAEERQVIAAEQRVRSALIPFQYVPPFESDLYCFYPPISRRGSPVVVAAHHDDFELRRLLGKRSAAKGVFSFKEHLTGVLWRLLER